MQHMGTLEYTIVDISTLFYILNSQVFLPQGG